MRVEPWEEFWLRSYEEKWCITLEPDYLITGEDPSELDHFPHHSDQRHYWSLFHQWVPQWGWHGAELLAVAWLNMEYEWAINLDSFKPGVKKKKKKKSKLCKELDRKYFIRLLVFRQSLSILKLGYVSLLLMYKVFFVYCSCNSHIKCIVFKYFCSIWISSLKYL